MKFELLAPAGNLEILYAVINAGANAVYIGGPKFGARAYAKNFTEEEICTAISYAHLHNVKLYMTVNTLVKDSELKECIEMMIPFYEAGLDGVIIQDMGVLRSFKEHFPNMELHSSTQMSISDVEGAKLMKSQGICRIVPSRELSLKEIKKIHDEAEIEIESFVHGALCYCYSGQCLLSSVIGGRSGNRGRCAQPCRLPYDVYNENMKKIKATPTILSLKDLCTIEFLPELLESGVYSLKIEGRMKQASYAYTVVSIYRKYLDYYETHGASGYKVSKEDYDTLLNAGNRNGFTSGYYHRHNGKEMITTEGAQHNSSAGELDETAITMPQKIMIQGEGTFKKGEPASLRINYQNESIQVFGSVVEQAKSTGMDANKIKKQLLKTGGSFYEFSSLSLESETDIFLPVSDLNKLRRQALDVLTSKLVNRRIYSKPETFMASKTSITDREVSCMIRTLTQGELVLKKSYINAIYIDLFSFSTEEWKKIPALIRSIKEAGKAIYGVLPFILRDDNKEILTKKLTDLRDLLDGVVARSYDGFGYGMAQGYKVIADQAIYSYSAEASEQIYHMGAIKNTIPYELNHQEIKQRLIYNHNSELIIYGRLPVMISAGCVHKNTEKCDKISRKLTLRDRKGYEFPVINECTGCYNIIFNSAPTCLFNKKVDFEATNLRLSFTTEEKAETKAVLNLFEKNVLGYNIKADSLDSFTWGHYKRGVE